MKITEIRACHVACESAGVVRNAISQLAGREALVVEVVADSGLSGWGACSLCPSVVWEFIRTRLSRHVLGRESRPGGALWRTMLAAGDGGAIAMGAISALDVALWDLRGRMEGVPVSSLLGGRLRQRVRTYASGPFMQPGDAPYRDFGAEVERYLAAGFRAVKARAGVNPRADAAMVTELRARVGPDVQLMVDFNCGYARPAALEALCRLEPAGLLWIEEPIAADDLDGYRLLAAKSKTPLAAGEALSGLSQFRALLGTQAIGVVQPDLYLCGGFSGASRIAVLAEVAATPYCPHVWGTAIDWATVSSCRCSSGTAATTPFSGLPASRRSLPMARLRFPTHPASASRSSVGSSSPS
jgi:D-galactarolactone cycloisomerase